MWPQTKVSDSTLISNLNSIKDNVSYKTGRRYAGRTTNITSSSRTTVYSEEYKYNNEYYAYVPQYGYDSSYTYSDGTTVAQNGASSVWIKVEPIKWVINNWSAMPTSINSSGSGSATYIDAYSVYAIVSGMAFYPNTSDTNRTSWTSSCWRAYLNGYDLNNENDANMASIKANFAGEGFIDTIYHEPLTSAGGFVDLSIIEGDSDISYSVQDYVYFPSYNDVKNSGNYGFTAAADRLCEPTDWALANYAYLDTGFIGMGSIRSSGNGSCWWWSRSDDDGDVWYVDTDGYMDCDDWLDEESRAARVALHLNLGSSISALSAGNARTGSLTHTGKTYHTIELGNLMYPQTIVSDSSLKYALNNIVDDSRYKTGKKYAGYTTDITSSSRTTVYSEEYKYNNEYYVYVPQYGYGYSYYTYSDDNTMVDTNGDSSVWIKVEPIKWVINNWNAMPTSINPNGTGTATYIDAYSVYAIVSGMCYYPDWEDENCASWTSSCLRAYLNGYDLNNKNDANMASIKANFAGEGFIDVIYHEVQKPLTSAGGFVDLSSYSVEDYAYFPSYNDIENSGNYGFTSYTDRICEPTDWSLANCAYLNASYTGMGSNRSSGNGSCYWWSRSTYSSYVWTVSTDGSVSYVAMFYDDSFASRVALHLNLGPSISALSAGNGRIGTLTYNSKTYHTIELDNLMYPQTIVSDSSLKTALNNIVNNSSYKTGTRYAGYTLGITSSSRTTAYSEEYKYNNEYYVYVPQYGRYTGYTYSDGTTVARNGSSSVWIKVEPIKWVINNWNAMPTSINPSGTGIATYIDAYSVYGIVSGLPFYPNDSDTHGNSWTSSCWRAYLNGYNLNNKNDANMASIKANFAGEGFIDVIYHNLLISVDKPYATNLTSYTYTGSTITHSITNYNSNYMTRTGDTSATDVGTYTVTFTLKQGYCWSDNSTGDVTLTWYITKQSLTKPTINTNPTFQGTSVSVSPTLNNYNSSLMTLSGDTSATSVKTSGTYTITISLTPTAKINYQWSGGGTENISLSWNVLPKDLSGATITLPQDSFVYDGTEKKPEPTVTV